MKKQDRYTGHATRSPIDHLKMIFILILIVPPGLLGTENIKRERKMVGKEKNHCDLMY